VARGVRFDERFLENVRERVRWLERDRPAEQRENLQRGIERFVRRVIAFPGMAEEVRRRDSVSYRVSALPEPLPYIVYYSYDEADADGLVSLLMLLHEAQDRARSDPSRFED
jgi:plasmid stabilization system protein ParE